MFFTNNLIKNEIIIFNYISNNQIYEDMINNCDNYLKKILDENDLTLSKIYNQSLINEKSQGCEYKGVYLYLCEQLEKSLFQIYKYLTKNIPVAQNI